MTDHTIQSGTGSSPLTATTAAQVKKTSPFEIIAGGCHSNDTTEVARGLRVAAVAGYRKPQELLTRSLTLAVRLRQPDVVRYLLDHEGAPLDALTPGRAGKSFADDVSASQTAEVFQILVDRGWDINRCDPYVDDGQCLLQQVYRDESLVRWCLDHGALVEDRHPNPFSCQPLLELVATFGTVPTFTLLHSHGAQIGPRTLHRAVSSAAGCSRDSENFLLRMAMVKYLVDDLGLDVNALDTEGRLPNHWGTPLSYAINAGGDGTEVVVRFLLDRGADPSIKDRWGLIDALGLADKKPHIAALLRRE